MQPTTIGISSIIWRNMTTGEIEMMERTCASTWNVIKETTLKIEQNENHNAFIHRELQNLQGQVSEFGKVLERMSHELEGLRRDVRNMDVRVIE